MCNNDIEAQHYHLSSHVFHVYKIAVLLGKWRYVAKLRTFVNNNKNQRSQISKITLNFFRHYLTILVLEVFNSLSLINQNDFRSI